jgi:hypothetical protein
MCELQPVLHREGVDPRGADRWVGKAEVVVPNVVHDHLCRWSGQIAQSGSVSQSAARAAQAAAFGLSALPFRWQAARPAGAHVDDVRRQRRDSAASAQRHRDGQRRPHDGVELD